MVVTRCERFETMLESNDHSINSNLKCIRDNMIQNKLKVLRSSFFLALLWIVVWLLIFFGLTWALDMKTPVLVFSITLWLSVFADVVYKFFERRTESSNNDKLSLLIVLLVSAAGIILLITISKAHPDFLIKNSINNFQGQQQFVICESRTGKRIPEKMYLSGTTVESEKYDEYLDKAELCKGRFGELKKDQFERVVITRNGGTFLDMLLSWLELLCLPLPLFVLIFSFFMRMLFHKDIVKLLLGKKQNS